jgi:hypothetical protein
VFSTKNVRKENQIVSSKLYSSHFICGYQYNSFVNLKSHGQCLWKAAELIECQQDSIEIVKSVQEENSKKIIIVNAIYMEVENQMQLDRVKRMLVRVHALSNTEPKKIAEVHFMNGHVSSKLG